MTGVNTTDEERQLRRELKWAREALSVIENGGQHQGMQKAHAEQIPIEFRAKFLESPDVVELERHIGRLESDLESVEGGFL